jgi:hypothetical protein
MGAEQYLIQSIYNIEFARHRRDREVGLVTRGGQRESLRGSWHERLRPLCADACPVAGSGAPVETVRFFVARWCQKETGVPEPDIAALDYGRLADIAARVVRNLDDDGPRVERLVAGDAGAWTELRRLLYASAHSRTGAAAGDYADEALQKIAIVLLTGTPPSQAVRQLAEAIEGPCNEYIFTSPFPFWARTVVINLIVDDRRRQTRERAAPHGLQGPHIAQKPPCLDAATLERAQQALPALLAAVRELPRVQRSVMVLTLARRDLDPIILERLRELAPDLFDHAEDGTVGSDHDIAERLGTTPHLVAANRSAARCKLAARDPYWKLLLDMLLPHRSTHPAQEEDDDG